MGGQGTELEIRIRTIAEEAGIKLTEEGLQRVKERTQELSASFDKNANSTSGVTEEMKRAAQETLRMQVETKRAATTSGDLRKELHGLKEAGSSANQVLGGLSQGGITGLLTSARGAIGVVRSLASGALGTALLPAVALAGVALVSLNKISEKLAGDMKKMWDDAAKAREAYAAGVEANAVRVEAALKKELTVIEAMNTAYERQRELVEKSRARVDRLEEPSVAKRDAQIDLDEQAALKKAQTPEAKDKVKAAFSARRQGNKIKDTLGGFSNADSRADIDINQAQDEINKRIAENRNIEAKVREAEQAFEMARQTTRAFDPTDASKGATEARKRAQVAKDNLDKVKVAAGQAAGENAKAIEAAQAQIDAANLTKEETSLRRDAYKAIIELKKGDPTTSKAEKKVIDSAVQAVEGTPKKEPVGNILGEMTTAGGKTVVAHRQGPSSGGTITRGSETIHVDAADTVAKLAETGEVLGKVMKSVEYFSTKVTADGKKLDAKLKNTAESRAGS